MLLASFLRRQRETFLYLKIQVLEKARAMVILENT